MVDYSKWSHIVDSDDEEQGSSEAGGVPRGQPRVTRLAGPSRVTIPGRDSDMSRGAQPPVVTVSTTGLNTVFKAQASVSGKTNQASGPPPGKAGESAKMPAGIDYSKWDHLDDYNSEEDEQEEPEYYEKEWYEKSIREQQEREKTAVSSVSTAAKTESPCKKIERFIKNGRAEHAFCWSQNGAQVFIHVRCKQDTRAKNVQVSLVKETGTLRVMIDGEPPFERKLWRDVWGACQVIATPLGTTEEEEDAKEMEWELEHLPSDLWRQPQIPERCVSVTLSKVLPTGLVKAFWWERVFSGGDETDVVLQATRENEKSQKTKFKTAWDEAHQAFLTKVKMDSSG